MDTLTTLLAAAAATGPNTLQSQALTALRSAGPQESFFTRMGNPHPLQRTQRNKPRPIFLHSTQGSWPFWHSWRCRTSKHCAAAHTTSCSPAFRQWQGDLHRARGCVWPITPFGDRTRHTAPTSIRAHAAPRRERQMRRLPSKDRSRSRTRPQHRRHSRSRSHRQDRRPRSHVHPRQPIPTWQAASAGLARRVDDKMELQGTSNTPHRLKRRIQPILAATDGGRSTFGLIYGLDPGSRNRATAAAISSDHPTHRGPQQHQSPTTTGDGQAGRDATPR